MNTITSAQVNNFIMKIVFNHDSNTLNTGGKNIYQPQNNADYYYEDSRPKIEQSNIIIPQLVSLNIYSL